MPQRIPQVQIKRLNDAGLHVCEPFQEGHVLEHGVVICKPAATFGNSIPGFETEYDSVSMNAPAVVLYPSADHWVVSACFQGPFGEDDFKNEWETPGEAVDDVIDYYLGKPERMQVKAARWAEYTRRLEARKKEHN